MANWKNALSSAAAGAGTGAAIAGPIGAGVGGIFGGLFGLLSGDEQKAIQAGYSPQDVMNLANQMRQWSKQDAEQTLQANRANQIGPQGSLSWEQGPGGQWTQRVSMTPENAAMLSRLQSNVSSALTSPFSLSGLPSAPDAERARQQAIDASYNQAAGRLDQQWAQREAQTATALHNQGLRPGDAAYDAQMRELGRQRNDAYTSAMNAAIGSGSQAAESLFGMGQAQRQGALQEALLPRQQTMSELASFTGTQMPQFSGYAQMAVPEMPNMLGAWNLGRQASENDLNRQQLQDTEMWKGISSMAPIAKSIFKRSPAK